MFYIETLLEAYGEYMVEGNILVFEARIFVITYVRNSLGWMGRTTVGSVHGHGEPGRTRVKR